MRLGTRGSALALAQARLVAQLLEDVGHGPVEVVTIATAGDRAGAAGADRHAGTAENRTAGAYSDKSRWVNGLERALAAGEIDLAVHSAKDVPGELAAGLELFGTPARAAVEDVLCLPGRPAGDTSGVPGSAPARPIDAPSDATRRPRPTRTSGLDLLPAGARVGTSSLRRAAQLRAARADVEVVELHGNVDTRLRKLAAGSLDAIVLARAGLERLGRATEAGPVLDPARFVPAPGQGALALEGRTDDDATATAVRAITDERAFAALRAERALAGGLDASCATPLGAHAYGAGADHLHLRAWVGLPDGSQWIADELTGDPHDPQTLGQRVAERMLSAGAAELLAGAAALAQAAAVRTGAGR